MLAEAMPKAQGRVYDPAGFYDEALMPDGTPRPEYGEILAALAYDPGAAVDRVLRKLEETGAVFGGGAGTSPFLVDPVPRIITRAEWQHLAAALAQRASALNAFLADVYTDGRIVREGIVPGRAMSGAIHFEPRMLGADLPHAPATVIGFDVVRGADGLLRVLEDNCRTPSGIAYAEAARYACDAWIDDPVGSRRRPLSPAFAALGEALRAAAPIVGAEPNVALLTDGPANSAWYEHHELADRLGIPVLTPADLRRRQGRLRADLGRGRDEEVHVLYRRTDEDRLLDDQRRPTWISDLLLEPIRNGTVSVLNAFGAGVADDKLSHAYVEEMIRFYLGEEPLIESVPTFDLGDADARAAALGRAGDLVFKPRSGHGGAGIVFGSQLDPSGYRKLRRLIAKSMDGFVAQEVIAISRHPTLAGGRLEPRHVDLRVFAVTVGDRPTVIPAPLTRVSFQPGSLVVNSSRGGGGKDTWVLA
jgi:carboxylate-amine ligase